MVSAMTGIIYIDQSKHLGIGGPRMMFPDTERRNLEIKTHYHNIEEVYSLRNCICW